MKIVQRRLPRDHNLYFTTDKHYGTILQHRSGIRKSIKEIKDDPIGFWTDLGDMAEGITVDDKRYCVHTVDPESNMTVLQYQAYVDDHLPIADKCLVVLEGNHDWKLGARVGSYVRHNVCTQIGNAANINPEDLYGTYSCILDIKDKKGNNMYKVHMTHGNGSISSTADDPVRREANMQLSLKRKLRDLAGDCLIHVMGHVHKLIVKPPISRLYLNYNDNKATQHYTTASQTDSYIPEDLRWYVGAGCFYKLYEMGVSGYAERAGYPPNELGYVVVKVRKGVVIDIEKRLFQ